MIGQLMRGQASHISMRSYISAIISTAAMLVVGQVASAQYESDFEAPGYAGSAAGTVITGQDAFYVPVVDSQDGLVFTYASNAMGLPQNPRGGDQFAGVIGGDVNLPQPFARAQRDIPYDAGGGDPKSDCCVGNGTPGCDDKECQIAVCHFDPFCCETDWDDVCAGHAANLCGDLCGVGAVWTVTFDIAATYLGVLPSADNIGSFSTQLFPDAATFIALARWTDPATAANWNADYVWFDAAGVQLIEQVSDPGFQNLQINHWYRWSTTFDLDTNLITEVALTDLTTNVTVTNNPVDKYLWGGAAGAPTPSGFRLFGGTNTAGAEGNALGFDNINVATPSQCPGDLTGPNGEPDGVVDTLDLLNIFANWGPNPGNPADLTGPNGEPDGTVDTLDLLFIFAHWGPCP